MTSLAIGRRKLVLQYPSLSLFRQQNTTQNTAHLTDPSGRPISLNMKVSQCLDTCMNILFHLTNEIVWFELMVN